MNDEYVTDPALLEQLNAPSTSDTAESEYVTDPELLAQLNGEQPYVKKADITRAVVPQLAMAASRAAVPTAQLVNEFTKGGVRDLYKVGKILYNNLTPMDVAKYITEPVKSLKEGIVAYGEGHPWANATARQAVGSAGRGLLTAAVAPENIMTLPYSAAAYEREKIRANPNAPEYAQVPYAQEFRGEYPTQGAAAAANARQAIANAPTGYRPTAQEARNILASNDERMIGIYGGRQKLQQLADQLQPVAPGASTALQGAAAPNNWMQQALTMANPYR